MPMIEIAPDLWLTLRASKASAMVEGISYDIDFRQVSGLQRALTDIKESKQYAAWLKKEGLA